MGSDGRNHGNQAQKNRRRNGRLPTPPGERPDSKPEMPLRSPAEHDGTFATERMQKSLKKHRISLQNRQTLDKTAHIRTEPLLTQVMGKVSSLMPWGRHVPAGMAWLAATLMADLLLHL